jgi:hypothetical protein
VEPPPPRARRARVPPAVPVPPKKAAPPPEPELPLGPVTPVRPAPVQALAPAGAAGEDEITAAEALEIAQAIADAIGDGLDELAVTGAYHQRLQIAAWMRVGVSISPRHHAEAHVDCTEFAPRGPPIRLTPPRATASKLAQRPSELVAGCCGPGGA